MEENSNQLTFYLQQGFAHKLKRKLVINKEFIEYETSDQPDPDSLRIYWKDFKDIRYGVELINGYAFSLGRKFRIHIRDQQQDEIRINLISLYGMRRKQHHEAFCAVADAIHKFFLNAHVNQLMEHISHNGTASFEKLTIDQAGICFRYNRASVSVPWEDVAIREYKGYFFLQNKSMPGQAIKISYLEDWNGTVIFSLMKTSLQMLSMPDPI